MCLVSPHMHSKTHLKKVEQMLSIWQPLCDCGKDYTKASVFHHTAAQLEICLVLIVFLFKRSAKALTPCFSHFLRKVLLDDTWARVSSFRGNGERISRGRWAPLNTAEEVDLARLLGSISSARSTGGVWEKSQNHIFADNKALLCLLHNYSYKCKKQ